MAEHVETHAARTYRLRSTVRYHLNQALRSLDDGRLSVGDLSTEVSAALRVVKTLQIHLEGGRKSQTAPEATEGQPGPYSTT